MVYTTVSRCGIIRGLKPATNSRRLNLQHWAQLMGKPQWRRRLARWRRWLAGDADAMEASIPI